MITKEQLTEWLSHPVTKEYKDVLDAEESAIRRQIGDGALLSKSPETMGIDYAQNIGKADGIRDSTQFEDRFYNHERVIEDED